VRALSSAFSEVSHGSKKTRPQWGLRTSSRNHPTSRFLCPSKTMQQNLSFYFTFFTLILMLRLCAFPAGWE
jgi:hypothetical protein